MYIYIYIYITHEGRKVQLLQVVFSSVFVKIGASRYLLRCISKSPSIPWRAIRSYLSQCFFSFGNRFFYAISITINHPIVSICMFFWGIPLVISRIIQVSTAYWRFLRSLPPCSLDTGQVPEHINGSAAAPGLQWNLILDKEGT